MTSAVSLAAERDAGRRIVIAVPGRGNNYNVLTAYSAKLEAEFLRRGWQVTVADAGSPDFLPQLLAHASDPDAVVALGHFFYDLRVSAQNHFSAARVGDLFRGRLCAMVADHPFTSFMWPRMEEADPRVVYFAADPGFAAPARCLNRRLDRIEHLALPIFYDGGNGEPAFRQRPIDVLVPVTFRRVGTMADYAAELQPAPRTRALAEQLYARIRDDREHYPFDIFLDVVEQCLGTGRADIDKDRTRMRDLFSVLSRVDLLVRDERRVELVGDLLKDSAGLRLHFVGNLPPGLQLPPGAVSEGPIDAGLLGRRMSESRMVVHCHPTYPQAMHERVITAMAAGCVVISDSAPVLEQTFTADQHWLRAERGASLKDTIADVGDPALEKIAAEAQKRVQAGFDIGSHVDALLDGVSAIR